VAFSAAAVRDAAGAWTYSQAQAASHAFQRRVGVLQGQELGFHGLRVEGYNLSKRGNGEDLTVAHGLWKSSAHKRYDLSRNISTRKRKFFFFFCGLRH
jgi:hypothetical protein